MISCATLGVAVAVNAANGTPGKISLKDKEKFVYDFFLMSL
jgi:hypothetical protein